jgi:pimeloyl-ACP methyl ester carboxylesterase
VHIVAAVPPIDSMEDLSAYSPVFRMTLLIGKYTPSLLPSLIRIMVKDIRKNVYQYLEKNLHDASEQDREILKNPRLRSFIAAGLRASVQHGEQEISREVMLSAQAWGIDLDKIAQSVSIWHGEHDPLVSLSGARKLAELLPDAKLTQIPDAGHYLLYSHWQSLLQSVKADSLVA